MAITNDHDHDHDHDHATDHNDEAALTASASASASVDDDDDQYVPFDINRFSDGAHGSMYMKPPCSPFPKNQRFARRHQKKKLGRHSRQTRHSKLKMITPLPDSQVHSNYHLFKYDRVQSRADKSSAGSDHDSKHKHHLNCHINLSDSTRRYVNSIKKKPPVKVDTDRAVYPCPFQLKRHCQQPSLPIQTIADVSIIGKPIFSPEPFDMSKFTNSYPHPRGKRLGQRRTNTVKKRINSVAA